MGKRGRPRKDEASRRDVQISFRASQRLRDQLVEAARHTGDAERSLSQEIELRLRASFKTGAKLKEQLGGPLLYQLFRIVAQNIRVIESQSGRWFENRFAFDEAKSCINTLLDHLRPRGRRRVPQHLRSDPHYGRRVAQHSLFILEAALRDPDWWERQPQIPGFVDPIVASTPFAGRLTKSAATELARENQALSKRREP